MKLLYPLDGYAHLVTKTSFLIFWLILKVIPGYAQDNNYWSLEYGGRTALLGGIAVADSRENSAIFYNPGGVGFITNPSLAINANAYALDRVVIAGGKDALTLKSTQVSILPLMVSGVRILKNPRHVFGYTTLTRQHFRYRATDRIVMQEDVVPAEPGRESFSGQYYAYNNLDELWGGLCYAYRVHPNFSVGISVFGAYRSQNVEVSSDARASPADPSKDYFYQSRTDNYILMDQVRLITKLGAEWHPGNSLALGAALTLPSISLYGNATVSRELTQLNFQKNLPGIDYLNLNGLDVKRNLYANYKSPLAFSLGVAFKPGRSSIAAAAEWFYPIKSYYLVHGPKEAFFQNTNARSSELQAQQQDWLSIYQGSGAVLNFGLAAEVPYPFNKTTYLLASLRINPFAPVNQGNLTNTLQLTQTSWDIGYAIAGVRFVRERSDLNLGLKYGYGRKSTVQSTYNFTQPQDSNYLEGVPQDAKLTFTSLAIILAYTLKWDFKKDDPKLFE